MKPFAVGDRVRASYTFAGFGGRLATVKETYPIDGKPALEQVVRISVDGYPGGQIAIAARHLTRADGE